MEDLKDLTKVRLTLFGSAVICFAILAFGTHIQPDSQRLMYTIAGYGFNVVGWISFWI